jgi:dTDP-4-amino-4,6-dideoxygalactose transaminase
MEYKYVVGKPFILTDRGLSSKIEEILISGVLSNFGPQVNRLEDELKRITNKSYCVTSCNASQMLELTIQALDLPKDSYVCVPSYTFIATVSAILRNNLKPLFIDISPEDFCMDYRDLQRKVFRVGSNKISLVLPVALFGNTIHKRIADFCCYRNIPMLVDCAHSLGMIDDKGLQYSGISDQSSSIFSVFSFHPTKVVSGSEGGCLVTNNKEIATRIKQLSNFGFNLETTSGFPQVISDQGINAKMSELQAVVNLHQLTNISVLVAHYKKVHDWYKKYLPSSISLMSFNNSFSNYSYIVCDIGSESFDSYGLIERLKKYSILAKQYFYPVHLYSPFENQDLGTDSLPITNSLYKRTISLPTGMHIHEEDVQYICTSIKKCI